MKILFQGDSITDAGRGREDTLGYNPYGNGYVQMIAGRLMADNDDIEIVNRGCGGNRIGDMYARWIEDTLNLEYDVLSILCGINDIGFAIRQNRGADAEEFEFMYDRMITAAIEKQPNAKLVICEPFIMKLEREEAIGNEDIVDNWEIWDREMRNRRAIVKRIAQKHNALFVPFGEMFDEVLKTSKAIRWTPDGIHMKAAASELLARKWLECCKDLFE